MEWISVKDSLPEKGKKIKAIDSLKQIRDMHYIGSTFVIGPIFAFWGKSLAEGGGCIPTHWAYISEPPKD